MINKKQYNLVWYRDGNKLSHIDPKVFTKIENILKGHFGYLVISKDRKIGI